MLPVFQAILINEVALDGGTTMPCLMMVEDEQGQIQPDSYVVKVFTRDYWEATCREVFAHVLAGAFDLQVPDAALVKVDIDLILELRKRPEFADRHIEPGYFFATKYLSDAKQVSPAMSFATLNAWDMEQIFAFDVLIRNSDRRVRKPNFLLHHQTPVLIDHELSLRINRLFTEYAANNDWNFMSTDGSRDHVFLSPLREKYRKKGVDFSFMPEYLRTLNPRMLLPYAAQLEELGNEETEIVLPITDYLQDAKTNRHLFPAILTDLLQ